MKKILYTIFIIIMATCFYNRAFAEKDYTYSYGLDMYTSKTILSQIEFPDKEISCPSTSPHYNYSKNAVGDIIATWKPGADSTEKTGKDTIDCTACKGKKCVGINVTLTYTQRVKEINVVVGYNEKYHIINNEHLLSDLDYITKFGSKSANFDTYFALDECPLNSKGSECKITFKSNVDIEASIIFFYMNKNGEEIQVNYTIREKKILDEAFVSAYAGEYGTCDFKSPWNKYSDSEYLISKGLYPYYLEKGISSKLPSCTSSKGYIKFVGWITVTESSGKPSQLTQAVDACKKYTDRHEGTIYPGGTTVSSSSDRISYFACYETQEGFLFNTNGGVIENKEKYENVNGGYFIAGTEINAPNVTFGVGKELVGWQKGDKTYKVGEKITEPGTYTATYIKSFGLVETTTSGSVYVNDTTMFVYPSIKFASCKSTNEEYATANIESDGKCYIHGIKGTGENTVEIVAYNENKDDKTAYTIKMRVIDKTGLTESGNDSFVIDLSPVIHFDEATSVNIDGLKKCDSYSVTQGSELGKWVNGSGTESSFAYIATDKCLDQKYLAICLDPGRSGTGTGHIDYKVQKSMDLSGNTFDRAVYYVSKYLKKAGITTTNYTSYKSDVLAANAVVRVLSFKFGEAGSNPADSRFSGNYNFYKKIASQSADNCEGKTASECLNISGFSAVSGVTEKAQKLYKDALTYALTAKTDEQVYPAVEFDSIRTGWSTDSIFWYEKDVRVSFPSDEVSDINISPSCSATGITCSIVGTPSTTSHELVFTARVEIDITTAVIPTLQNKDDLSFTLSYNDPDSIGNGFVIEPTSNNMQRMVILSPKELHMSIYMGIPAGSCDVTKPKLNYTTCTSSTNCNVNKSVFKAMGCCDFITDRETHKFAYQYLCGGGDCTYNSFTVMCDIPTKEDTLSLHKATSMYDVLKIKEARTIDGAENYSCIVDINSVDRTKMKVDGADNSVYIKEYEENEYCMISCKEDWNITTSAFENFVGVNAVAAGSYFSIDSDNTYVGGTRTCVTTEIQIDKYRSDIISLSNDLVSTWNKYSMYSHLYSYLKDGKFGGTTEYNDKLNIGEVYQNSTGTHEHTADLDEDGNPKIENTQGKKTCYGREIKVSGVQYDLAEGGKGTLTGYTFSTNDLGIGITDYGTKGTTCAYGKVHNGTSGSCPDMSKYTEKYLKEEALKILEGQVLGYTSTMSSIKGQMHKKAEEMSKCQNWTLEVQSGPFQSQVIEKYKIYKNNGTLYGDNTKEGKLLNADVVKINTGYNPTISFDYAEKEYMTLIGNNNVLDPFYDKDEYIFTEKGITEGYMKSTQAKVDDVITGKDGKKLSLYRNYHEAFGYKTDKGKGNNVYNESTTPDFTNGPDGATFPETALTSVTARVCSFACDSQCTSSAASKTSHCTTQCVADWVEDIDCAEETFNYYNLRYIKRTLSNSSFFKNRGNWYSNGNDVKAYGRTLEEAVKSTGSTNTKGWSIYGSSTRLSFIKDASKEIYAYSTFPIKITTRKNIYQYSYYYSNIGSFNDGTLGRILGGRTNNSGSTVGATTSVVANNAHSCFYEVYENICECCGDSIDTETVMEKAKTEFIAKGYKSSMSNSEKSNGGKMGFYTSTISLGDLDSDSNRTMSSNWNRDNHVYLGGTMITTNKGAELATDIERRAEVVYNVEPEYSYSIDPSAVRYIKDYNDKHSYDFDTNRLYVSDPVKLVKLAGDSKWASNPKQEVSIYHYGSVFLAELDKKLDNKKNMNQNNNDIEHCFVLSSNYGKNVANLTTNESAAIELTKSYKCRWIDYVQEVDEDGNKYQVRLAFK